MCRRFPHVLALVLVLSLAGGTRADLVGHWRLDEGSGATARDASGNGNDGTLGGTPAWVPGMLGNALEFSGDDRVNCGEASNLSFTQPFSITLWVNPADLSGDHAFAGRSAASSGYAFKSYNNHLRFTTPGVRDHDGANSVLQANTWQHVAVTFVPNQATGCVFYVNGVATDTLAASAVTGGAGPFEIGHNHWEQWCVGMIDDVRVYDQALTAEEVVAAMLAAGPEVASDPIPEDEATDVPADSVLSWTAGELAATHDVYLGTSFDDVNDASRNDARGVLAGQGQADATFDPEGLLEYGATYYWRIDEVNAAPDFTIFKGGVWSFTVEPFAYPVSNVTATASSAQAGMDAQNAVDGSGLNANDEHSTELTAMWMASGSLPAWIQFEFDGVYKLDEMLVWNSNQLIETFLGFGAKSVTVEYSADGETWTALEGVPEFARASGTPSYAANTTVDFGGVMAQFVKLTINSNWGGVAPQTGLSEVRFLAVPVCAREPMPADDATGVSIAAEFNWRPGREATSHEVHFGADANALTLAGTVTDHSFTPEAMDLGTTYYWRVDEVGDAGTYEGEVWSFTTEPFAVVDDMESYNDDDNRIYDAWIDGLTDTAKGGSQVGYDVSPFAEKTIVHSGSQSMPLIYNDTGASIAEAEFAVGQDWTASGTKSLSLWFRGAAGNTGALYVKINNTKVPYDGPASHIGEAVWHPWNIDLSAVGGNFSNVSSLTIGVEGSGAAGTLYIDDIRLYPRAPEFVVPVQPDNAGLVAQWLFEGNLRDSVGANHGTAAGDARVATDPARGQVLSVDGNGDKVDIPYSAALNPPAFTVSCWAWPDAAGTSHRSPITSRDDGPQRGYILYIEPGNTWQFWTGTGTGWNAATGPLAQFDEWNHVAATFANDQKVLYVNGVQVGQSTAVLSPNTQQPLRIGAGASEGPGNYFFRGFIDDVRLYNRALSPEEAAGLAGHTNPVPKPF